MPVRNFTIPVPDEMTRNHVIERMTYRLKTDLKTDFGDNMGDCTYAWNLNKGRMDFLAMGKPVATHITLVESDASRVLSFTIATNQEMGIYMDQIHDRVKDRAIAALLQN